MKGAPLRLHYSWFIAFILITAAVATQFSISYPLWQKVILGIAASFLFLIGIVVREFAVTLIAHLKGVPVRSVTLFALGGVIQTNAPVPPGLDLLLAVVGLLSNLILAAIFYVVYFVLAHTGSVIVHVMVQWLAFIYFMLVLLHFIPAYPLDGGRALRAGLHKIFGRYELITLILTWLGWVTGLLFIGGGVLLLITAQEWFTGGLLAFAGFVLQSAATDSRRQVRKFQVATIPPTISHPESPPSPP